jgi:hypothetical protein
MRLAWQWFNRVSTCAGVAFMLTEAGAWTLSSVQAGHVIRFTRFHLQFEQKLFRVFDRDAAPQDGSGNCAGLDPGEGRSKGAILWRIARQ